MIKKRFNNNFIIFVKRENALQTTTKFFEMVERIVLEYLSLKKKKTTLNTTIIISNSKSSLPKQFCAK